MANARMIGRDNSCLSSIGLSGVTGGDEFAFRTPHDTEEGFSPRCLRLLGRVCVIEMVSRTMESRVEEVSVVYYLL